MRSSCVLIFFSVMIYTKPKPNLLFYVIVRSIPVCSIASPRSLAASSPAPSFPRLWASPPFWLDRFVAEFPPTSGLASRDRPDVSQALACELSSNTEIGSPCILPTSCPPNSWLPIALPPLFRRGSDWQQGHSALQAGQPWLRRSRG